MNKLDAAEIVLRGNKLKDCEACYGKGHVLSEWADDYQNNALRSQCSVCNGAGKLITAEYQQALKILNRKPWVLPDWYQMKYVLLMSVLCFIASGFRWWVLLGNLTVLWVFAYVGRNVP